MNVMSTHYFLLLSYDGVQGNVLGVGKMKKASRLLPWSGRELLKLVHNKCRLW